MPPLIRNSSSLADRRVEECVNDEESVIFLVFKSHDGNDPLIIFIAVLGQQQQPKLKTRATQNPHMDDDDDEWGKTNKIVTRRGVVGYCAFMQEKET